MKIKSTFRAGILWLALGSPVLATSYGSVEPVATPDVIDTGILREQPLEVRAAFAERLLQCGIVDQVIDTLRASKSVKTINGLNVHFEVGAGGFAGATNPSFVYTVLDSGPNAASIDDIKVVTDSLGYVFSQGSAFLLDADEPPASFDFPANYVVLNFDAPPSSWSSLRRSSRPWAESTLRAVRDRQQRLHAVPAAPTCRFNPSCRTSSSSPATSRRPAQLPASKYTPIVAGRSPALFDGRCRVPRQQLDSPARAVRNTVPGFRR